MLLHRAQIALRSRLTMGCVLVAAPFVLLTWAGPMPDELHTTESAGEVATNDRSGRAAADEVTFVGNVQSISKPIGAVIWTVAVDEVKSGPAIAGTTVTVRLLVTPACLGYADQDIAVGECVEVQGLYDAGEPSVSLCESSVYYIRRLAPTPTPTNPPEEQCSITIELDSGKTCFLPGDPIDIRLEFRSAGQLVDPDADPEVLVHLPSGTLPLDFAEEFVRLGTGTYSTPSGRNVVGSPGARRVEVTATIGGCRTTASQGYLSHSSC